MLSFIHNVQWEHPGYIHLLWLVVAITVGLFWLEYSGRRALSGFISEAMVSRLSNPLPRGQRIVGLVLFTLCLVFGTIALRGPYTRSITSDSPSEYRADILVALDVSRSMLATDTPPNRLARAKAEIAELTERLPAHRFGLIAFAGRAEPSVCPLTTDLKYFRDVLRNVDTNTAQAGGTNISAAIRIAMESLGRKGGLLLLITDGEDHQPYALEMAESAKKMGIRIVTIGFGSETGSPIDIVDPETKVKTQILDAAGEPVISKLNAELLTKLASTTGGRYIPATTAALDLDSIVKQHVEPLIRETEIMSNIPGKNHQYHWFVLGALLCLFASTVVTYQGKRGHG